MGKQYTHEELKNKKRIINNTLIQVVGMAVNVMTGLLMTGLLARYLGTAGYGELSMSLVYFSLAGIAACPGYDAVMTRELSRSFDSGDHLRSNAVLSAGLLLRALSSGVAVLGVGMVLIPMHYSAGLKIVILLMSLCHLASILNVFDALFKAALEVRFKILAGILYRLCHLALIAGCVVGGASLSVIVLTYVAANLAYGLLLYRFSSRLLPFRFTWDGRLAKELFLQALPLGVSGALWVIYFRVDMLMLSALKGIDAVSFYNAAYRFVDYGYMVSSMLIVPIYPLMAARYLKDPEGLRRLYCRTFDSFALMGGAMGLLLILGAPFIVQLLYGSAFQAAGPTTAVFGFIFPLILLSNACGSMLLAMALPGRQMIALRAFAILLNVGLNMLLIPPLSFYGAALATVLSELVVLGVTVGIIRKHLGYFPSVAVLTPVLILCVFAYVVSTLFRGGLLTGMVLPAALFVIYLALFQRNLARETWAAIRMRSRNMNENPDSAGMTASQASQTQRSIFDDIYVKENYSDIVSRAAEHQRSRKPFLDLILNTINQGSSAPPRILEIGCGTAIDLCTIADKADCIACGIDLSIEALIIAKEVATHFKKPIHTFHADALQLPFPPATFDVVFSQGVLEHFSNDEIALREQWRVLRPGGRLVVNVPQKYTMYTVAKHIRMYKGTWPWGRETEYSYGRLRALGRRLGMRETAVIGYDYWLHPLEPAWVLRSLASKLQRINPARHLRLFARMAQAYDRLGSGIEARLGHRFMRNIVIVFEKSR